MKRILAVLAILLCIPVAALAADATPASPYVEGRQYVRLSQPVPVADPQKIEVVEVFWYGCIHCFHLEPLLEKWQKTLAADVDFHRSPAMWNPAMAVHAQAFYAAQALGVLDRMNGPLFAALNGEGMPRKRLENINELARFFAEHGVDEDAFRRTFTSFGVESAVKQADARARGYGITGTPELIVAGKYRISGRTAGSPEEMLKVVDYLVAQERAARAAAAAAS